jgi:hypothetical protein
MQSPWRISLFLLACLSHYKLEHIWGLSGLENGVDRKSGFGQWLF